MKMLYRTATIMALLGGLAFTAQAQVVIGDWQSSTAEGWINPANGLSITDPSNVGEYSFVAAGVPGYGQSLQVTQAGFASTLQLNLSSIAGGLTAFNNNHLLSFTFSAPSSAASGSTAGYDQIYNVALNGPGYGYNNLSWSTATFVGNTAFNQPNSGPNYYYFAGSPQETQTVTLDYSSAIAPLIAGGEGYLQITFQSNNGGGAPTDFWMNNVELSGGPVPEPTSLALLGGGLLALGVIRRRK